MPEAPSEPPAAAAAAAAAEPPPPPPPKPEPRAGAAIWHRWNKDLWWPAYVLHASELPGNMREGRVDENDNLLVDAEVPLYYYGTHNYFWEKRSRLSAKNNRWRPAETPPPPRGDPATDPDLQKALQAHELQLQHNDLLQLDFEYEEERAEQRAAEEGAAVQVLEEIWIAPKDPKKPKRPGSAYTLFCGEMSRLPQYRGGGFGQHIGDISARWKALPERQKAKYRDQIASAWDKYHKQMAKYTPLPLERVVNPTEQQKKKLHKQIRKAPGKRKRQELLQDAAASGDAMNSLVVAVARPTDGVAAAAAATAADASSSEDATSKPAPKKRRKKAEASVKRARSAYNFFASETVRQLAVTQQGKSMAELSKLVGPEWRRLSAQEREKYDDLARADRERFAAELETFTTNKEEALRKRAAERAAEDELAKERKLVIKSYVPQKLNQKQNLLLAIEEMRVYQEANMSAAEKRKANRIPAPKREKAAVEKPLYQPIRANNYLCQKPPVWKERAAEGQSCVCEADSPCMDDTCLNRAIYWECDKNCNAGETCQNHRFQKREYADVKPFKTEWKGWGLKASGGCIFAGAFVMEYVGEVLDVQQCENRLKDYKKDNRPLYLHVLNDHMVIDAGLKGNMARFINHSCEPNCTTIRWVVHGEDRIGIFALRDIVDGEEITIDYSWSPSQVGDQPCYCGASSCTGFIGEKAFYDSSRQGNLHGKTKTKTAMMQRATENGLAAKDDECFVCRGRGSVICCDIPSCSKVYHRGCLDPKHAPEASGGASVRGIAMKKVSNMYMNGHMSTEFSQALEADKMRHWHKMEARSEGKGVSATDDDHAAPWRCPWHFCNACNETAVKGCAKCPISFCHKHGNDDGGLVPFAVAQQGKRLQKVHTYKSAAEQDNQHVVDQAASAGRHGGVMLCRQCVERGYDRDGERVWAKVKGYPWWPATIRCESASGCIRNHLGRIHVHFAKGSDDDRQTYGWCTLKEIMDFEEGYENLKDATPYPAKTARAKSMNQWYKRAVKDAWEELHEYGGADGLDNGCCTVASAGGSGSVAAAQVGGRGRTGRGASRARGSSSRGGKGGRGRGRGRSAAASAAASASSASSVADSSSKPKPAPKLESKAAAAAAAKSSASSSPKPPARRGRVKASPKPKSAHASSPVHVLAETTRRRSRSSDYSQQAVVPPRSKRQRGEAPPPLSGSAGSAKVTTRRSPTNRRRSPR